MSSTTTAPRTLPPPKPDHAFTRKPTSKMGIIFWRWRMWFESTFVLSMLEPWEKIILLTIFAIGWLFFLSGLFKYLPRHMSLMQRRTTYYLLGQEGDQRLFWQWLGLAGSAEASATASPLKEL